MGALRSVLESDRGPPSDWRPRRTAPPRHGHIGCWPASAPTERTRSEPDRIVRIAYVTETYPPEINGVALTVERAVTTCAGAGTASS